MLQRMKKLTYRFATHVYFNSFALKDFILKNRLLPEQKISVIANGSGNRINTEWYNCGVEVLHSAKSFKKYWGIIYEKMLHSKCQVNQYIDYI